MIILDAVYEGDQVTLQDRWHNLAVGIVHEDHVAKALYIQAFATRVEFSKLTRRGHWRPVPGVSVIGHTPALVALTG